MTASVRAAARAPLEWFGGFLPHLAIRFLLAFEFGEAGLAKLRGENWFADIQARFPFPFSAIPADVNWALAIGTEVIGAVALIVGLATRAVSAALIALTVVAWMSVHAGLGYNVCDNGFKLPLIYIVLLWVLLLQGAGRASVDHWLSQRSAGGRDRKSVV